MKYRVREGKGNIEGYNPKGNGESPPRRIHKERVPLRPIVSSIGSVTYGLSEHLAGLLAPLVGNTNFTVKDSTDFVHFTKTLTLTNDDAMVSFDVQSLFTSVPTDVACEVAKKKYGARFREGCWCSMSID